MLCGYKRRKSDTEYAINWMLERNYICTCIAVFLEFKRASVRALEADAALSFGTLFPTAIIQMARSLGFYRLWIKAFSICIFRKK